MFEILAFMLGGLVSMLVDIMWWRSSINKIEKGLEFHEHYHFGFELWIVGIFLYLVSPIASFTLLGMGLLFVMAEWRQIHEIKGKDVKPGHPFAVDSGHFTLSTFIGIGLMAGVIASAAIVNYVMPHA